LNFKLSIGGVATSSCGKPKGSRDRPQGELPLEHAVAVSTAHGDLGKALHLQHLRAKLLSDLSFVPVAQAISVEIPPSHCTVDFDV
jgi:hypothetical protein